MTPNDPPGTRISGSLEEQVAALVDRAEIIDLLHKLCYLIDTFQLERMVDEVFAHDGSDDHGQGPVVGRDAILEWYRDSTRNVAAIAHNLANVMVEVDGDEATARSNVVSWTWTVDRADGDIMHTADYALSVSYVDELRRTPDGWRVAARRLLANPSKTGYATIVALGELAASQTGVRALAQRAVEPVGE